jgi:hypothetical protein
MNMTTFSLVIEMLNVETLEHTDSHKGDAVRRLGIVFSKAAYPRYDVCSNSLSTEDTHNP